MLCPWVSEFFNAAILVVLSRVSVLSLCGHCYSYSLSPLPLMTLLVPMYLSFGSSLSAPKDAFVGSRRHWDNSTTVLGRNTKNKLELWSFAFLLFCPRIPVHDIHRQPLKSPRVQDRHYADDPVDIEGQVICFDLSVGTWIYVSSGRITPFDSGGHFYIDETD